MAVILALILMRIGAASGLFLRFSQNNSTVHQSPWSLSWANLTSPLNRHKPSPKNIFGTPFDYAVRSRQNVPQADFAFFRLLKVKHL
jgi:hypothetical protein